MKRIVALLLTVIMLFSLAACNPSGSNSNPSKNDSDAKNSSLNVDKGLVDVTITIPALFFNEDTDMDEIKAEVLKKGYKSCTIQPDGSVTYVIPKKLYQETLAEIKTNCIDSFNSIITDEAYESLVDIQYDEDFTDIKIYVDGSKYTDWDVISALGFLIASAYYQVFKGVPSDKIDVNISYIDQESGEIKKTVSYREWLDQLDESETQESTTENN